MSGILAGQLVVGDTLLIDGNAMLVADVSEVRGHEGDSQVRVSCMALGFGTYDFTFEPSVQVQVVR